MKRIELQAKVLKLILRYQEDVHKLGGVYALFKGSEIIYIGRTNNIYRRLAQHIGKKDFDRYAFLPLDGIGDEIAVRERQLIRMYRPRLNVRR